MRLLRGIGVDVRTEFEGSRVSRLPSPAGPGRNGRRGLLVAVEGIDASGKSTVARGVVSRIAETGRSTLLLDRAGAAEAVAGYPASHLRGLHGLIWDYPEGARTSQLGFEHWRHLLVAWFHVVDHLVVRPAVAGGVWVVADSWFYKYVARFALTAGLTDAERSFAGVSVPSVVVWLDVDPEVCLRRRATTRATETGEWLGLDGTARAFVDYQRRVRDVYGRLASMQDWARIDLDDVEAVVGRSCARLLGTGK